MKATEANKLSETPNMKYIFDHIERDAKMGKKHSSLCIPVSKNQANALKQLGYTVTWYTSDEYGGGYIVYWGYEIPQFNKPNAFIDFFSFSNEVIL